MFKEEPMATNPQFDHVVTLEPRTDAVTLVATACVALAACAKA
jgi:hypothetical protein